MADQELNDFSLNEDEMGASELKTKEKKRYQGEEAHKRNN